MSAQGMKSRDFAPPHAGTWLAPMQGHWIDAARTLLSRHAALVRVTVTALRGSTPREAGATMLVDAVGTVGTIGGGRLEWHATSLARELLQDACAAPVRIDRLILGPELGQCCGGRVELWLERLTSKDLRWLDEAARRLQTEHGLALASDLTGRLVTHRLLQHSFNESGLVAIEHHTPERITLFEMPRPRRAGLWVFGAGHVGQALVRLLAELALFEITWLDSRAELLPACLPQGVSSEACADPVSRAAAAPAGTRFVVMTHDHALDYALCRTILARTDSAWLGLIGSASKSARFRSRLQKDGVERETLSRLTCPIGVPGITSKLPGAIAIAVAAQLLQQCAQTPLHGSRSARAEREVPGCAGDCGACRSTS